MLDIFKVRNSEYASVKIAGSGMSLDGILQNDLGISGANSFDNNTFVDNALQVVPDTKSGIQRAVNKAGAVFSGKGIAGSDSSAISKELSRYSWTGSSRPEFTVQIILVALKDLDRESVVAKSMQAMRCVYPDEKLGILTAPLGYNPGDKNGKVTLTIGKWFRAGGLIVKSANFTYSRICLKSGRPLFALGEINLEPFQAISYKDFRSYFKG